MVGSVIPDSRRVGWEVEVAVGVGSMLWLTFALADAVGKSEAVVLAEGEGVKVAKDVGRGRGVTGIVGRATSVCFAVLLEIKEKIKRPTTTRIMITKAMIKTFIPDFFGDGGVVENCVFFCGGAGGMLPSSVFWTIGGGGMSTFSVPAINGWLCPCVF
jgi:hypothetical protein